METTPTPSDIPTEEPRRPWWRRAWVLGALAGVIACVVFVLVVFQPQRLFIDDKVDEALPGLVVAGDDTTASTAPSETVEVPKDPLEAAAASAAANGVPVAVTMGSFESLDHPTSGEALLVVQPDGSLLVRIENLDTDNGPDLHLVLSTDPVGSGSYETLIELGALKGNVGNANYEVPADVDISEVRSVIIWCERFSAAFGEAPLDVVALLADAPAEAAMGADVRVIDTPYGPALGTADGKVLYTWEEESGGAAMCIDDECVEKWPPLLADDLLVDGSLDQTALVAPRPDGSTQVTVNGRRLYTMALDEPGEANCQGSEGWWITNPDGSVNTALTPSG